MSAHPIAKSGTRKRRPGRPSKLTPEVMTTIISAIKCGAPNKVALSAAGISHQTFYNWQRRAEEPNAPREYVEFLDSLTRARQEGIAARLAIIQKASRNDWRAAAWLLERDMPDVFSLRYKIEHTHREKPFTLADALSRMRPDYKEEQKRLDEPEIQDAETW